MTAFPDYFALVVFAVVAVNAALGAIVLGRHRQEQHVPFAFTAFVVAP